MGAEHAALMDEQDSALTSAMQTMSTSRPLTDAQFQRDVARYNTARAKKGGKSPAKC